MGSGADRELFRSIAAGAPLPFIWCRKHAFNTRERAVARFSRSEIAWGGCHPCSSSPFPLHPFLFLSPRRDGADDAAAAEKTPSRMDRRGGAEQYLTGGEGGATELERREVYRGMVGTAADRRRRRFEENRLAKRPRKTDGGGVDLLLRALSEVTHDAVENSASGRARR